MNSSHNEILEKKLMLMEPSQTMPDFEIVWKRFADESGKNEVAPAFQWKDVIKKWVPVPAAAIMVLLVVLFVSLINKPFESEGEWFNRSDHFIKVSWRGNEAAISPGGHIRLTYPEKNRQSAVVTLYSGLILCRVNMTKKDECMTIRIPEGEVFVKSACLSVGIGDLSSRISVAEGTANIRQKKREERISTGQTIDLKKADKQNSRLIDGEDLSLFISEMDLDKHLIKRWSISIEKTNMNCVPDNADDCLWVTEGPKLWKLSGSSGAKLLFSFDPRARLTKPSVGMGSVLAADPSGAYWVLNKKGRIISQMRVCPGFRELASPEIFGKYLVYPTLDAYIWLRDNESGAQKIIEAPEGDTIFGSPHIDPGMNRMYYTTGSGKLYEYDLKRNVILNETVIFNDRIIFPVYSSDKHLFLFDRRKGRIASVERVGFGNKQAIEVPELAGTDDKPVMIGNRIYWFNSSDPKGEVFQIGMNNGGLECKPVGKLGEKITGLSGTPERLYVSTDRGDVMVYLYSKFNKLNLRGKVAGSDNQGVYIVNQNYIYYYAHDIINQIH